MPEEVVVPIETVPMPVSFKRYRVMFADGSMLDIIAGCGDGSVLREFALAARWGSPITDDRRRYRSGWRRAGSSAGSDRSATTRS